MTHHGDSSSSISCKNKYVFLYFYLCLTIIVHILQWIAEFRTAGWWPILCLRWMGGWFCLFDACFDPNYEECLGWFPGCMAPSDVFLLLPSVLGNDQNCWWKLIPFQQSSSSLWCSLLHACSLYMLSTPCNKMTTSQLDHNHFLGEWLHCRK